MSDEKAVQFSESVEARHAESLARVSTTLKKQLSEPTDESLVLVASAHMELKRIPADFVNAARVECLLDVAQFFNVSGRTILGIEPVSQALQFARQVADPNLLRKALTFSGILLADSGNLPGAIECYAG